MKQAKGKTKELAKHGRFGDDRVVHINALEEAILKAMGGSGTRNPQTGLREYFDVGDLGGVAVDAAGGNFGDAGLGAAGATPGIDSSVDGSPGGTNYGAFASPQSLVNADKQMPGAPSNPFGGGLSNSGGLGQTITDTIAKGLNSGPGLVGALGGTPFGALAYGAQQINDSFFGGQARTTDSPEATGRNDALMAAYSVQPAVQQAPSFMRPPETELPASLGLPSGLSDLQKRTMIATYGSQGAQSQFRTPEAMRAYGNLIARALIGDNNQVTGGDASTLPIEDQYLRQAFGINKPNSASALLEALRPYWSK